MSESTRRVAGETLSSTVGGRMSDRMASGNSGALFARLGVSDPWGQMGGALGGSLARLHAARTSRELRLKERLSRADRFSNGVGSRFWPGERRSQFAWGRGFSGEYVFPKLPLEEVVEEEEAVAPRRRRRPMGPTMRPVENAWHSGTFIPARVAAPTSRHGGTASRRAQRRSRAVADRPMARAGARLGSVVQANNPVARELLQGARPSATVPADKASRLRRVVQQGALAHAAQRAPAAEAAVARSATPTAGVAGQTSVARVAAVDLAASAASTVALGGVARVAARSSTLAARDVSVSRDLRSPIAVRQAARSRAAAVRSVVGPMARLVQTGVDKALPDASVSPLAIAASRLKPDAKPRGLRPVMWQSPVHSAVFAAAEREAEAVVESSSSSTPSRAVRSAFPGADARPSVARSPRSQATKSDRRAPSRSLVAQVPSIRAVTAPTPSRLAPRLSRSPVTRSPVVAARLAPRAVARSVPAAKLDRRPVSAARVAVDAAPSVVAPRRAPALQAASPTAGSAAPRQAVSAPARQSSRQLSTAFARVLPQALPNGPVGATGWADRRSMAGAVRTASVMARPVPAAGAAPPTTGPSVLWSEAPAFQVPRAASFHSAAMVARAAVGARREGSVLPRPMPRAARHGAVRELFVGRPELITASFPAAPETTTDAASQAAMAVPPSVTRTKASRAEAGGVVSRSTPVAAKPAQRRAAAKVPSVLDFGLGSTSPTSRAPAAPARAAPAARGVSAPATRSAGASPLNRAVSRAPRTAVASAPRVRPAERVAVRLDEAQLPAASRSVVPRPGAAAKRGLHPLSASQRAVAAPSMQVLDAVVGLNVDSALVSGATTARPPSRSASAPSREANAAFAVTARPGVVARTAGTTNAAARLDAPVGPTSRDGAEHSAPASARRTRSTLSPVVAAVLAALPSGVDEIAAPARLRSAIQQVAARREVFASLPEHLQSDVLGQIVDRVEARADREQLSVRVTPPPARRRPDPWSPLASPIQSAVLVQAPVDSFDGDLDDEAATGTASAASPRTVKGPPASVVARAEAREAASLARSSVAVAAARADRADAARTPATAVASARATAHSRAARAVPSFDAASVRDSRAWRPRRAQAPRVSRMARRAGGFDPVSVLPVSADSSPAPQATPAVRASRRSATSPAVSRSARAVSLPSARAVRSAVQGLVERRSRPSALAYARLSSSADGGVRRPVGSAPSAVSLTRSANASAPATNLSSGGARSAGSAAERTSGVMLRTQSASAPRAVASRPLDWADVRTQQELAAPVHPARDAARATAVYRATVDGVHLASWEAPVAADGAEAPVIARQGRHVARTQDGRFVPSRQAHAMASSGVGGVNRTVASSGAVLSAAGRGETAVSRAARQAPASTLAAAPTAHFDGVPSDGRGAGESRATGSGSGATQRARGPGAPVYPSVGGAPSPFASAGAPRASGATRTARAASRGRSAYLPRPGLGETFDALSQDQSDAASMPVWARRASGEPLDFSAAARAGGDLFANLARARRPEDVVRVIVSQGHELQTIASSLPQPVIEVIETIRQEARKDLQQRVDAARRGEPRESRQAAAAPEAKGLQSSPSRAPNVKMVRSLKAAGRKPGARRAAGVGGDRVMKLAQRLESLIHIAEGSGDRDAARRQVRMAEDSAAARAEGQGGAGASGAGNKSKKLDVEALSLEVLSMVDQELKTRRERRPEDPDGFIGY